MNCPNCGKDVDNLELHNSQFHDALEVYGTEEENQWTCSVCGKELPYGSQVGEHLLTEHNITAESKATEAQVAGGRYVGVDPTNTGQNPDGSYYGEPTFTEFDDLEEAKKFADMVSGAVLDAEQGNLGIYTAPSYKAHEARTKKEIQKEIKHLQDFINVASFENPLNMGADNDKLSALQVEWANATEAEPEDDYPWEPTDPDVDENKDEREEAKAEEDYGFAGGVGDKSSEDAQRVANNIMEIAGNLWDSHGWGSGADVDRSVYESELKNAVYGEKITREVLGILTDENFHTEEDILSSLATEVEPEEKWDKDDDIGRNFAEPVDDEIIDDDSYWAGRDDLEADEIEHQEDKPEMTQKDWDKDLEGLKDDYATEEDDEGQKEVEDFVINSIKDIYDNEMPEKPSATEDHDTQDGEERPEVELYKEDDPSIQYDDDGKVIAEEDTSDYEVDTDEYVKTGEPVQKIPEDKRAEEAEDDKYTLKEIAQMKKENMKNATEDDDEVSPEQEKEWQDDLDDQNDYKEADEADDEQRCDNCGDLEDLNDDGLCDYCHQEAGVQFKESERDAYEVDETETSDDGTDVNTPQIPDVDNTDTDDTAINVNNQYIPEFNTESWDRRVTFNTKVQAFEGIGLNQGDALKLAELNWRELSIEVRGELNEFADNEKEEKRLDIQDAFNEEGAGDGADQPDTTIDDLDEIDYNIIGDNIVAVEKYECEHCNSGFKSNEALMIHYNDTHASAREFMLDVPNTCTYCGQEIPANVSMGEHLAYEHGISLDVKLENGQVEDGYEQHEEDKHVKGSKMDEYEKSFGITPWEDEAEEGGQGSGPQSSYSPTPEARGRLDIDPDYNPYAPDPDPIGDPSESKMTETRKIKGNENLKKKITSTEVIATGESLSVQQRSKLYLWAKQNEDKIGYGFDAQDIPYDLYVEVEDMQPTETFHQDATNFVIETANEAIANEYMKDQYGHPSLCKCGHSQFDHTGEPRHSGECLNCACDKFRPDLGESWKPHVYKATEAVSYAEEDDIDEINDINKHAARGGKYNKLREPWETGSDWNRDEYGNPIGEADFKEDEHPREEGGKFTSGGSGGATKQKSKPKLSKTFNKAKDKILKHMGEPKDDYDRKKQLMIKNLDGYPQHSSQLRSVGVRYKVPIMKAHLQDVYPESKWSVRTEYFSMGSAIRASWTGGGPYPYGAASIKEIYSDSGATDSMVDYFDTDNYVDLYDHRKDKPEFDHGQHIYKDRTERFQDWARIHLDQKGEYEASNTWSQKMAEDFTNNNVTGYQGVSDDVLNGLNELYNKFQDQEKKEGGGATPKEVPKSTTPASYKKPITTQHKGDPSEFPIDPDTGEDLPVSAYNPNAAKYRKPDPEDTKEDVTKARGLVKSQKKDVDQPWQKGGEVE